jgi:hypothetical protein
MFEGKNLTNQFLEEKNISTNYENVFYFKFNNKISKEYIGLKNIFN